MNRFIRRLLLFAGLWWLFAGSDGLSWLVGGPVILALAAWRLNHAGPEAQLRLARLPLFVPLFVWRTLAGSCDVAWRALDRRLPIDPVVRTYVLRLPAGSPAQVFFANCLNLLPGTLTAWWEDGQMRIHVLTEGPQVMAELRQLERQVAFLFGHPWTHESEDRNA